MKITEIHVDRFGIWQGLELPTFDSGLNVIYGPNETGKSTLMRFVRGVLYGFEPAAARVAGAGTHRANSKGSLRTIHEGQEYDIHRFARHGERGAVSVNGLDEELRAEAAITQLLSTTSEAMFERLFAVDLHELQELASLAGDELADKVYGLTLGPEGRTILETWADLNCRRQELFNPSDNSGHLTDLFQRQAEISAEIESTETLRERHLVLSHERDELQAEIQRRRVSQQQLLSQQQGHRFLEQAWPAWSQVREIRCELEELPTLSGFPEDGLNRLARINKELDSLVGNDQLSIAEAKYLHAESQTFRTDTKVLQHAAAIEAVCEHRERLEELLPIATALQQRSAQAAETRDEAVDRLGHEWPTDRLADVDTSPTVQLRLLDAAHNYHGRLERRSRIQRRYKQHAATCSRRSRELQEALKDAGDGTVAEQIFATKYRLSQLQELHGMRLREAELQQRQSALTERLERIDETPLMPAWAYLVLGFFGVVGVIFALVGFYTGLTANGIVGLMYALLGTACGGTAYALKTHAESVAGDNAEALSDELRGVEIQLRELRDEMTRQLDETVSGENSHEQETPAPSPGQVDSPTDELVAQQTRHLAELQRLADTEERISKRRQQLSEWRGKLQQVQRDVISARQAWTEVLTEIGLKETLRVDEAFQEWQRILEAKDALQLCEAIDGQLRDCGGQLDRILDSIARLADQLDWDEIDTDDLLTVLDVWQEELANAQLVQSERQSLRREAKSQLRHAAGFRRRIGKLQVLRARLLTEGNASSVAEFEANAAGIVRRKELESALFAASAELETVCANQPELAIVEEDLLEFDIANNTAKLQQLDESLKQSASELQSIFERLGSVKQELVDLESDRQGTRLRCNRARVEDQMTQAAEEWFALELSSRALTAMQQRFERDHQPATLAAATKYLAQMTRGRYRNIWTPLGKQSLCVDNDQGRSFRVEQLSGGTREQLFLAIRLAIVEELSRAGVELPMVLDDVFANFDESRTEAAVETLLEFAGRGQQILLLTCHQHLARMLDTHGVNAIWLPESCPSVEERRAG
jgi:uncharacterized protein YhaN